MKGLFKKLTLCVLIYSYHIFSDELRIVDTAVIFDVMQSKALTKSIDTYLATFKNLFADEENIMSAEAFLNNSYFSSQSSCDYSDPGIGKETNMYCED